MERHANITKAPEKIKYPLQTLNKSWKTVFAYLRRSTKKEEQKDSKQKQNDSIDLMAKDIGINIEDIQIFEDDYTAFKITTKNGTPQSKRKGWNALMKEIDKCKETCILLAYDYSRLARNIPDWWTICEKLGLYWNKQKIEYIRFYDGTVWDKTTREKTITDAFSDANWYSDALSKQKQDKNITSLRRGIMPKTIKAPHGLKATDRGLSETDTMQYIHRAFEMKAEWTLGKDISKFLKLHWIPVSEWNLAFMVFQKTQYIGEYTHQTTGDVFEKLKFTSWKTAIPRYLWDKVQARLGKKVWGYGEKQKGDIIAWLLRWEQDRTKTFSLDVKTKPNGKQHKYYKSNSFGGMNIGEKKVIITFLKESIPKINFIWYKLYLLGDIDGLQKFFKELEVGVLENMKKEHPEFVEEYSTIMSEILSNQEETLKWLQTFDELIQEWLTTQNKISKFFIKNEEDFPVLLKEMQNNMKIGTLVPEEANNFLLRWGEVTNKEESFKLLKESLLKSPTLNNEIIEKENKIDTKKQLENKKKQLKEEKLQIDKKYAKLGYSADIANEAVKDMEKEIQLIDNQIDKLWRSTDMEQFIERLPEVLNKTFELASKVLSNEDIVTLKKDIEQLLEICTFELTINNKKELKIKLFDGLEKFDNLMVDGGTPNIRTFIENYDRVKEKYGKDF